MALRPVRALPSKVGKGGKESYVAPDVREFLRQQMDVACVEHPGKSAECVSQALWHYLAKHPEQCAGLAAAIRGGKVYLYRKGRA